MSFKTSTSKNQAEDKTVLCLIVGIASCQQPVFSIKFCQVPVQEGDDLGAGAGRVGFESLHVATAVDGGDRGVAAAPSDGLVGGVFRHKGCRQLRAAAHGEGYGGLVQTYAGDGNGGRLQRPDLICCANRVNNSRAACDSYHVNEDTLKGKMQLKKFFQQDIYRILTVF